MRPGTRRKNTKVNSGMASCIKTRARSKAANNNNICEFFGITHEIQIILVKLKPVVDSQSTFTNRFKCHICGQNTRCKTTLQDHLETHKEKTICCSFPNCEYKCNVPKYLEIHVLRAHVPDKLKPFECTLCKWRTHLAGNLKNHIKNIHNPDRGFNCTECNFTTVKPAMLDAHVYRWHGGDTPVECSDCEFRAVSKSTLAIHWKSNHEDQAKRSRPFKCPQSECSYAGPTAYKLRIHMCTHTGEKPFKCRYCPYASAQRCRWKGHERTHTHEKPYACTLCSYKCTSRYSLDSHIRSHTGERPYACSKCKYRATQSGHLSDHFRRYHTPQGKLNKFECPLCRDTFYRQATLESHMTRHTGERPFKCRFCGRGLTQSGAQKIHEKTCGRRHDENVQ